MISIQCDVPVVGNTFADDCKWKWQIIDKNYSKWTLMWILWIYCLWIKFVYSFIISLGIDEKNIIQLLLFAPEWAQWPLNLKGLTFYIKTCAI